MECRKEFLGNWGCFPGNVPRHLASASARTGHPSAGTLASLALQVVYRERSRGTSALSIAARNLGIRRLSVGLYSQTQR